MKFCYIKLYIATEKGVGKSWNNLRLNEEKLTGQCSLLNSKLNYIKQTLHTHVNVSENIWAKICNHSLKNLGKCHKMCHTLFELPHLFSATQVCEYFQDFDPLREHSIPRSQFTMGLTSMGQRNLTREESKALCDYYTHPQKPLHVQWKRFEKDIEGGEFTLLEFL